MNCLEIQLKISEWIDGEIGVSEETEFRGHLNQCYECSRVYEDLRFIKQSVRVLNEAEPAARVWSGIRSQLVAEGLIREERESLWQKIFPVGFSKSLKPAISGAIVAVILVVSLYFSFRRTDNQEAFSPVPQEVVVFLELKKAELHYQKAIEALNEVSHKKLESLDPALAQIFEDNLATMDYYLRECKDAATHNPENPLIQRYLLTAYQKKVELMQSIVNSDSL